MNERIDSLREPQRSPRTRMLYALALILEIGVLYGCVMLALFGYIKPVQRIIGMMIEPSGVINNASTATISEAVTNGWLPGVSVGVNTIAAAPDAIQLMPNPASTFSNVALNLKSDSEVSMEVFTSDGKLVASKAYGKLNGGYNLPIDTQEYAKGIYFVKVTVNGEPTILKLIKE